MTVQQNTDSREVTRALNEVGRRIQAFSRLDRDPKAQQAYWVALKVVTEVRDSERQR